MPPIFIIFFKVFSPQRTATAPVAAIKCLSIPSRKDNGKNAKAELIEYKPRITQTTKIKPLLPIISMKNH